MAAGNQIIKIEPSILVWARESLGLSWADVAMKLDKEADTIKQWESGYAFPTLAQLEKLAYIIYKRPLAVFFLPKPPQETTPKQDFRTLPDKEIEKLSPELRLIIRKAKHHQLVLKQINDGKNPVKNTIFHEFKLKLSNKSAVTAKRVREFLEINTQLLQTFRNSDEAYKFYRDTIEKSGIFVFQYPLKDARGFSLMDKDFPVILLNSSDSPNGRIFSLFHELCHILFNTGGVFRDIITEELLHDSNKIEVFCNQFASDVLVPTEDLLDENLVIDNGNNKTWTDVALQELANRYKVSKEVILRKLLYSGRTTAKFYKEARLRWNESYRKQKEAKKKKQEGGPSYHVSNLSHLGKNFVSAVLTNYHNGKLSSNQVADFLNIKINRIGEYEQKVFK